MLQLAHLQVLSEQDKLVVRARILRVSEPPGLVSLSSSGRPKAVVYLSPEDQVLNDGFLESIVQKKRISA
jgi:hypothetical protein